MINYPKFSINTSTGQVGITEFKFNSHVSSLSGNVVWHFGDGSTSKEINSSHIYYSPGLYTVTLYIYDSVSGPVSHTQNVEVKLALNHSIYFDFIPPPTFAGHYNRYPFRVHITSPDVKDHYVNLSCQFSRSDAPQEVPNKWSFLKPQWKFFDVNGNEIQKIKTTDTIILGNSAGKIDPLGSNVIGVSGYADFYFTDDIYNFDLAANNQPFSKIIATLDTLDSTDYTVVSDLENRIPSFANSLAVAECPHIFLWRTPDYLKITENGINNHLLNRWSSSGVPLIVNSNFSQEIQDNFKDGNGVKVLNPDTFFVHNFPLNNTESLRLDLYAPNHTATFTPEPVFEWSDASNYKIPGYYKGVFNLSEVSAKNLQINAQLTFGIPILSSNYYNPLMWIFTNHQNKIHICQDLNLHEFNNVPTHIKSFSLSGPSSYNPNYILAGNLPDYQSWLLFPQLNKLSRISSFGKELTSIYTPDLMDQASVLSATNFTPHSISLDSAKNVWLTIENSVSAFKLNSYGNLISATQGFLLTNPLAPITPVCSETDLYDNLYVSYKQNTSGMIVRYNPDGSVLDTISNLYSSSLPTQILCDKTGHHWTAVLKDTVNKIYNIEKRSFEWNLIEYTSITNNLTSSKLTSFGPYTAVSHLCLDKDQNLWITHNKNLVTKIFNSTYNTYTTTISSDNLPLVSLEYDCIGGLATNSSGKIYILNTPQSLMYVVNPDSVEVERTFTIRNSSFTAGDWTGFNWVNKYSNRLPEFTTEETYKTIYGQSSLMDFYSDSSEKYGLFKIGENYDLAQTIKDYAFTPKLIESSDFFDRFLGAIFGSYPFKPDDLGIEIYEKITNFISNHKDLDTCNIDYLYDAAASVDLVTDDFRLKYPSAIERLMNIASVNLSRVRGQQAVGELNFNSRDKNGFFNRGIPVLSLAYEVSGGTFLVLGDKTTYNPYRLIYTGRIEDSLFYDLDTLASYIGLPRDWRSVYDFYTYVPSPTGKFVDGLIDWSNPQTTLNFYTSSADSWFGSQGALETMFTYELYKGLNLLND